MSDRILKLTLAYDGSDFSGWQKQDGDRSVQGELEKALATMHGHAVPVVGAGRTDAGVHAAGQVAHFHSDIRRIEPERFVIALNKLMPPDVRVVSAVEADPDFHARYDARLRRYRYFMHHGGPSLPWVERYSWRLAKKPNMARLNRLASCLHGELDCTAFASAKDPNEHRFRYLHHAAFYTEGGQLVFDVAANAFLWRMVRSLVGTLIQLDAEDADDGAMARVLQSADRSKAGITAPPRGLFLWSVDYYDNPTRRCRYPQASAIHRDTVSATRLVPGIGWLENSNVKNE